MTYRRLALGGALALCCCLALATGVAAIRIADVHAPHDRPPLDPDADPSTIVADARTDTLELEHRARTRVYRVGPDTGDETLVGRYLDAYDYGDRQYLASYAVLEAARGGPGLGYIHHTFTGFVNNDPGRWTFMYASDAQTALGYGDADDAVLDGSAAPATTRTGGRPAYSVAHLGHVLMADASAADWRVVEETPDRLVLGVDGAETYHVRRIPGVEAVHEPSHVRLVISKDSGRLVELRERRVVTAPMPVESSDGHATRPRRLHYRIVVELDNWGRTDVTRPEHVGWPGPRGWLHDLLTY